MSDLLLVNSRGEVVEGEGGVNTAAFAIHSTIHEARPDVIAAAHSHSVYGKAWSSLGRLLDPLTQDACAFYGDHALFDDYTGVVLDPEEGKRIAHALDDKKAVILRNHGLLTVGHSVDEAVWWFVTMERSCQAQLLAEAAGTPVLIDRRRWPSSPTARSARRCRATPTSVRSTSASCANSPTCSTDISPSLASARSVSRASPGQPAARPGVRLRVHAGSSDAASSRAVSSVRSRHQASSTPVSSNAFSHASCSITPTRHSDELTFEPRRGVDPVAFERGAVRIDGRVLGVTGRAYARG